MSKFFIDDRLRVLHRVGRVTVENLKLVVPKSRQFAILNLAATKQSRFYEAVLQHIVGDF